MTKDSHSLNISVWADNAELTRQAQQLAERLALPLSKQGGDLQLRYSTEHLALIDHREQAAGPVYFDFVHGKAAHRRQHGGGRGQALAKAIGLKGGLSPSVLDCTAGMGRDAFVLASLGCSVTLLERSDIIHALLADALYRAQLAVDTQAIAARMHLHKLSALDYLSQGHEPPDVIYMDPMYPHRAKSALVKKEMRVFRELVGDDNDADALLAAALDAKPARVVVKRPKGAAPLANRKPSASVASKNTRYDIYPFRKLS